MERGGIPFESSTRLYWIKVPVLLDGYLMMSKTVRKYHPEFVAEI
jgi:hypothetical protein